MDNLISQLAAALQHAMASNQFFQGGIVLMVFGALAAYARRLPVRAYGWLQRRFILTFEVTNEDPLFYYLAAWLSLQPYSQRARSLTVTTYKDHYGNVSTNVGRSHQGPPIATSNSSEREERQLPEIILTPAPGNHIFLYKRRPIWLVRNREKGDKDSGGGMFSLWNRESFQIRMIARKQETARALIEEARALALVHRQTRTDIHVLFGDSFRRVESCDPRPLSSVFLQEGQIEEVLTDLKEFLGNKGWYLQRGIPWRRGYFLHGDPGSGKTSLIKALAGELRLDLYVINLGSRGLDDRGLQYALGNLPPGSIILLEDVDAAFKQRGKNRDVDNHLSFSGLLNALDGAASREGWIVFMTTNHVDKVDPALIRPGRADFHMEFTHATEYQASRMFHAFFGNGEMQSAEFGKLVERRRMSMASVQQHLILYQKSPVEALAALPVESPKARAVGE